MVKIFQPQKGSRHWLRRLRFQQNNFSPWSTPWINFLGSGSLRDAIPVCLGFWSWKKLYWNQFLDVNQTQRACLASHEKILYQMVYVTPLHIFIRIEYGFNQRERGVVWRECNQRNLGCEVVRLWAIVEPPLNAPLCDSLFHGWAAFCYVKIEVCPGTVMDPLHHFW